ncbi:MAG: hypothetical protein Q8N16_03485 [bacterium]|nr:hypothetical protein [bacterium]
MAGQLWDQRHRHQSLTSVGVSDGVAGVVAVAVGVGVKVGVGVGVGDGVAVGTTGAAIVADATPVGTTGTATVGDGVPVGTMNARVGVGATGVADAPATPSQLMVGRLQAANMTANSNDVKNILAAIGHLLSET